MHIMQRLGSVIFIFIFFMNCNITTDNNGETKKSMSSHQNENKKVAGIGGVFFKCQDTEKMKQWFNDNLGLVTNEYGAMFEFKLIDNPKEIGYLQWSPFSMKTTYFLPSDKEFMINYRVNNLESLLKELKANKVTILDSIESCEYGKFLHIIDPENNKIELWEPIDKVFTELYPETTTKKTGIGGIFFKSKDPEKLRNWYHKNLGFKINEYGSLFEFRNAINPEEINLLQWSLFSDSTKYFDPSDKQFMINYRVENIEGLVTKFRENGITILDSIEYTDFGNFVHIMAPEDNKIELWEPPARAIYQDSIHN